VTTKNGRLFYVGMALVALTIAAGGFLPSMLDTSARRAPITVAVGVHGVVFVAWLLVFLAQTTLVATGRVDLHRRLGYTVVGLAVLMVLSGYDAAIEMARRGFDLSGDLVARGGSAAGLLVFQLGDLVSFTVLVGLAVLYRKRADVHKRFMLLAVVGGLMPAALAHLIGHFAVLRDIHAPIILIPFAGLLFAGPVYDRITSGRMHRVSLWGAVALLVWANLRAVVIGPSTAWQTFAAWLIG